MGTIGIVALSLLGGAFILILLIASGLLVHQTYKLSQRSLQSEKLIMDAITRMETGQAAYKLELMKAINTINGAALFDASRKIDASATRIVQGVIALDEVVRLLVNESRIPDTDRPLPDAYGPDTDEPAVGQSNPAKFDAISIEMENQENSF